MTRPGAPLAAPRLPWQARAHRPPAVLTRLVHDRLRRVLLAAGHSPLPDPFAGGRDALLRRFGACPSPGEAGR